MKFIKTVAELREWRTGLHKDVQLGFVPTMGSLHQGHLELVKYCQRESDMSLVSIFLNPTQFNQQKDFETYPVQTEMDLAELNQLGVDAVFVPDSKEMYADDYRYRVTESEISNSLCGLYRPGHFDGVLTIVLKLFNLVQPSQAFFGEKDFQQLELIRGMVKSFFLSIEIKSFPTVRENSGLALSSRNQRLSAEARKKAPRLFQILNQKKSLNEIRSQLQKEDFEVDYLEEKWGRRFVAAHLDHVRLIDNVLI